MIDFIILILAEEEKKRQLLKLWRQKIKMVIKQNLSGY